MRTHRADPVGEPVVEPVGEPVVEPVGDAVGGPVGEPSSEQSLSELLRSRSVVIACGPGGVGKTTIAAAAAVVAAVRLGGRVLVVTVDPARRLADALGLPGIGNDETPVPREAFAAARVRPKGRLFAAMLDMKQSWDALVARHAPDESARDRILANPLYRDLSSRFVESHDYIAMERLFEIRSRGDYDLIVVDTPPARSALDFLDAPEHMAEFFSGRLVRWLTMPYRSRVVSLASKPFFSVADRILGTQFLADIAEFFTLFQSMHEGFVERARAVERLLADPATTFVVISTLEEAVLREGRSFLGELAERELHTGALVLNKVLPDALLDDEAALVAHRLRAAPADAAEQLVAGVPGIADVDVEALERVLATVGANYLEYRRVARRERHQRERLASGTEALVTIPFFDTDIYDVAGLLRLGAHLWPESESS